MRSIEIIFFKKLLFCCRRLSKLTHFTFRGHELSPIKHLYLKNHTGDREHTVNQLEVFVDKVSGKLQSDKNQISYQFYILISVH